jgi:hypothetical protein
MMKTIMLEVYVQWHLTDHPQLHVVLRGPAVGFRAGFWRLLFGAYIKVIA